MAQLSSSVGSSVKPLLHTGCGSAGTAIPHCNRVLLEHSGTTSGVRTQPECNLSCGGCQESHVRTEGSRSFWSLKAACVSSRDWQLERPLALGQTNPVQLRLMSSTNPGKMASHLTKNLWVLKARPQLWGACQHKHTGSNGLKIPKAERPHPFEVASQVQTHFRVTKVCVMKVCVTKVCVTKVCVTKVPQAYPWCGVSGKGPDRPCLAAVPLQGHATLAHKAMELQRRPKCGVSLKPFLLAKFGKHWAQGEPE